MRPSAALFRAATLIAVLAIALVSSACGSGGGGPGFGGTLEVMNDGFSSDILDSLDIDEVGGPDHFSYDVFLDPGESFFTDLFPDDYDVTIFWHDGSFEVQTVTVLDGHTSTLVVTNP